MMEKFSLIRLEKKCEKIGYMAALYHSLDAIRSAHLVRSLASRGEEFVLCGDSV